MHNVLLGIMEIHMYSILMVLMTVCALPVNVIYKDQMSLVVIHMECALAKKMLQGISVNSVIIQDTSQSLTVTMVKNGY